MEEELRKGLKKERKIAISIDRRTSYGNEMRRREKRGERREQTKRGKARGEKIFLS